MVAAAVKDAKLLDEGGVDGLSFENLGDAPFFKKDAPPETIASLGRVIGEVKRASSLPIGVNVLRNCASASLALSYAYGGRWIRVNVLTEAYVTDQGIVEGVAYRGRSLPLEGAYVFCNLDEYRAYFEKERIDPLPYPFTTLLKAGPRGSYLIRREGLRRFAAFKTKVRDTNGAGDAFNAGFIYARLGGFSEEEACVWGNAVASLKVSRPGPHPRIHKMTVEALVRGRLRRLSSRRGGRYPPRPA